MMGRGYGCPMMGNWIDRGWYTTTAPMTIEQATTIVQNYVLSTGNPNLKLGGVKETDTDFEFEIVTRDDSLVDKILVDKRTRYNAGGFTGTVERAGEGCGGYAKK